MERYEFKPRKLPLINGFAARRILEDIRDGKKKTQFSPDLGKTMKVVEIERTTVKTNPPLTPRILEKLARHPGRIYLMTEEFPAVEFSEEGHYYKLRAVGEVGAPTVEIDGIHMHRIKEMTPWQDSKRKISLLSIKRGNRVLDICTGLGYTAILATRSGGRVITIEKSKGVLEIAEYNPYSWELDRIPIILGDATEVINEFEEQSFDRVLLDPPRFSVAGELYGENFYAAIFRIIKKSGIFVHYVGAPGRVRGKKLVKGVTQRLKNVGFEIIGFDTTVECVISRRP